MKISHTKKKTLIIKRVTLSKTFKHYQTTEFMYNPQETEKEILKFWEEKKIFEKLREKNKGKKKWSFLDGPITANNPMGVHHAWGRTYKDLFQRFKAMQGHEQRYQNGFDCQGLWVEREEEKSLGLKDKKDIENYGIKEFVESCKKRVEKYSRVQTEQSIKLGMWMDWENSYYTNTDSNQLHNWHLIKKYHEKGLIYKGMGSVPWCWRCGTASSKHDITTEGYKEVTHKGLFMQFPIKGKDNEYFLIFTTTPWTVPANVAIAVNPNVEYVQIEDKDGVKYWIAQKRLGEIIGEYDITMIRTGTELEGIEYYMPYESLEKQAPAKEKHQVVLWDLATEEDGTGIVHIAPGCGAEDHDLGKKIGLPAISPLDEAGIYGEGFGEFSGKKYSQVNKEVLEDMEQRRFVYKITPIKHRYPHCWRCGEELVFRLVDEWYIKCTEEFRKKLKEENEKVKWYPEYGKLRQNAWFDNMGDWLISRKRYYGMPLPIWECEDEKCNNFDVIGSIEELKEKAYSEEDIERINNLVSMHRPWIDEVITKCGKCGRKAKRIIDVGDAWLDAGIVPFSTIGPYLEDKEYWKEWYPADLISENMPGQARGWFNALFWSSVMLTGQVCFKELFGYESLRDEKGEEMHKSKGNAIWFDDAVEKVGADPIRLLYCLQDPSQELRFGYNNLKEPKNNMNILYNMSKLIERTEKEITIEGLRTEDKWLMSKLNSLIKTVTEEMENLHPHQATRALQEFWLKVLSRGYIQLVRDRIAENDETAKKVLMKTYNKLLRMTAPTIPFVTEKAWQELKNKNIVVEESVHLTEWPKVNEKLISLTIEKEFEEMFKIIEKGLAVRDKEQIGLKWPLKKATINTNNEISEGIKGIIMKQLNVKSIEVNKREELSVELTTEMTPELEAEGYSRELSRKVQEIRKKKGMVKTDEIILRISAPKELLERIRNNEEFIKDRTNSKEITIEERLDDSDGKEGIEMIKIKNNEFGVFLTK
ncbi:isoleucine--tRNA ligase [Candidatus Pacearchaeota archaeon CG10_big_fil_rev_8_21_14_0_10_35_13]|nr:MAG: isoleucine--tRNA ligase [Candidatus Pacearchaeota archaeon CG10_big_fil_rev_8_21_14_0_10_35_13]